ncbi:MAG TPA: response regulator [Allocoleopsis sp.]
MKILLVEDDETIAATLAHTLNTQNYIVEIASDGQTGWELALQFNYDLLLLDVMLPHLDGITFCRRLRSQGNKTPVLLLTARNSNDDKIIGLDAGADDYIVKPFNLQEVLARIRAVMRRGTSVLTSILKWDNIQLDTNNCQVLYRSQEVHLSPKEYALLELFLRNPERVFSRRALLDNLWTLEDTPGEETVRAHIKGLRQKLKIAGAPPDLIDTVYGLGYRLKPISQLPKTANTLNTNSSKNPPIKQQIQGAMKSIWERCKEKFSQQIDILHQGLINLQQEKIDANEQETVRKEAHKLAGSLGMFGLTNGSRVCREIEQLLELEKSYSSENMERLINAVIDLKHEILSGGFTPEIDNNIEENHTLILLIDEDGDLGEILSTEASNRGIKIQLARNASIAKNILTHTRPDVILLDLAFSQTEETGLNLLSELTEIKPAIPVLVFTSSDSFYDRVEVARLGGRGFLNKEMPLNYVWEMINQVQKQRRSSESKIIVLDDDPVILMTVVKLLEPWGIKVITLDNPLQFWETLEDHDPDLVILDVEMPEITGIEICQVVRNDPRWKSLPMLFLTVIKDADTVHKMFAAGADDYVSKPIVEPELITRIINRLERVKLLRTLAEKDALTQVSNRHKSTQDLNRMLRLAKRYEQPLSLVIIDLDHFKQVNDQYGHGMGDKVLRCFGEIMQNEFRSEDIVGRWGGEEFVIGMYGINKQDAFKRLSDFLKNWKKQQFATHNNQSFSVNFSAGIADYPSDANDIQQLYKIADNALYKAKAEGRDRISF